MIGFLISAEWLLIPAFLLLLVILTATEQYGWTVFAILGSAFLVQFTGTVNLVRYCIDNPLGALGWVGAYLACGVAWSFAKWIHFLFKQRDILREHTKTFITSPKRRQDFFELKYGEDIRKEATKGRHPDIENRYIENNALNAAFAEKDYTALTSEMWTALKSKPINGDIFVLYVDYLQFKGFKGAATDSQNLSPSASHHKSTILAWMSLWPFSMVATLIKDPFRWLFDQFKATYQRVADSIFKDELANLK